ncbi:hypothetical protein, partial [Bifidobacterium longum]|uniref:hypothetical protein n=1 Tax=Bifidobacterium longum TaxID=216816 RepID=UPI001C4E0A0C
NIQAAAPMPITSPGNDDDTGENHQPTLRKNTAEPVEQTLKQNNYFRVPLGASWKTRLIGRFPKNGKPWNKAKNDHMRLSSEVRMMMVVMVLSVSWA